MAIRRPTKKAGVRHHKSVASAPLRHVDVRAPQQVTPGEVYVGWQCKNLSCGRVIAIAVTAAVDKALTDFDHQLTAIKCPHCGMKTCIAGTLGANRNTHRKVWKPDVRARHGGRGPVHSA